MAAHPGAAQSQLVLATRAGQAGASSSPHVTAAASCHRATAPTPGIRAAATAAAATAATASATAVPAGAGSGGSVTRLAASAVNTCRTCSARAENARSQPRTVEAGRPSRPTTARCPDPAAFASKASPITSPASARRARHHADRKSTRLNSSHITTSYAVFCLKKKKDFKIVKEMGLRETGILTSASDYHIFNKLKKTRRVAMDFFFNDTATTEIYTLSLHDALPI